MWKKRRLKGRRKGKEGGSKGGVTDGQRGASAHGGPALAAASRRQDARATAAAAAAAVLAVAPAAAEARARHSVSGPPTGVGAPAAARSNKKRLSAAVHATALPLDAGFVGAAAGKKRTASVRPEVMLGSAATLVGTGPAPPSSNAGGGGVMVVDAAGARRAGAGGPSSTMMRGGSERDPNVLSEYLQVEFDDVFAEPEGTYSLNGVWKAATLTFTHTKNICYRALSLLCAVPLALIVGISFACLSFQHIWCIGPAIRHCRVNCHVVRQYMRIILESCCAPCFYEMGLVLSRIRVQHVQNGDRHHMEPI
ncbi:uncharacterized protein [Dermacentor albipictus]|uniref:uncharacterized protein n=1 Tax=Dermacentor albipictus TaxID=60249 RepID=UPI0031FE38FB